MCYPRDAMVASHRDPADRLMVRARVRMRVNIIPHRGKTLLRKSFWNH